jgi:CheY-like chemotaxis protein/HEAT repeat protein
MDINNQDYIDEVLYVIKRKDTVKAKALLQYVEHLDENTSRRLVFELTRCDDEYSMPLFISLFNDSEDFLQKIPNMKNILLSKFLDNPQKLVDTLEDPKIANKKFFAEVAGEIQCEDAVQTLLSILNQEDCDNTLIATILEALGTIGSSEATNTITDHLYSRNKKIIVAAIKALRKIATPTAMQRLAERMGTDNQLDLLIIDVFAQVQDSTALEKLNMTLVSHNAFIRNYGKSKLIDIGEKAVPVLIGNLLQDDPDLLIHSLNALGLIGDRSAISPIRKLLFREPKDPNVRFAAYEALGLLPLEKETYVLASGLADPVDNVCMAAAKAINKNYNDILSAGIRNILADSASDFHTIIRTIIDSESDNIFLDLINNDLHRKYAIAYLKNKSHKDIKKHFVELLQKKGFSDIAAKLEKATETKGKKSKKIFVVDDSRMILKVYRTTLHKLGFDSELFEFPSSAIQALTETKPDILITDLNMPDITGIELTIQIRKKFPAKDLPVIMVTTQNEAQDNEAAEMAGVDIIMQKPFNETTLGEAINRVLKK